MQTEYNGRLMHLETRQSEQDRVRLRVFFVAVQ